MSSPAPIGAATKIGLGVGIPAFGLAIAAYLTGDHSQQTLGVIVAGVIGLIPLIVAQFGRYGQAKAQIAADAHVKAAARSAPPLTSLSVGSTSPVQPTVVWNVPPETLYTETPVAAPTEPVFDPAQEVPGGSVPTGNEKADGMVKP